MSAFLRFLSFVFIEAIQISLIALLSGATAQVAKGHSAMLLTITTNTFVKEGLVF